MECNIWIGKRSILNISKDNLNKIVKIADNFKEIKVTKKKMPNMSKEMKGNIPRPHQNMLKYQKKLLIP